MRRPEILAPAGDRDALAAALAAGADAVYLGLDDGFNARARAENFPSDGLAEIVSWVHRAGARLYVTLNTLVFEPELPIVEELIRRVAAAGTDAIIVQDPAVCRIARAVCPDLEIHASTQMTASSPLAVGLLADLGLSRVVVPRELSVDEIRAYAAGSAIPLEVFIHGALCVAWSGQCLSSEAWGGRSANRGQCAQACRLPYGLVVDGADRELGEVEYLLSPKDLAGTAAVAALAEIGVASLKIEGRLKGPHYVATAVTHYRRAVAEAVGETLPPGPVEIPADDTALHVAYSRGISAGFLGGADHQTLVEGRFPRHRGLPLGKIVKIDRDSVYVVPDAEQRPVTGGLAMSSGGKRLSSTGTRVPELRTATAPQTPTVLVVPDAGQRPVTGGLAMPSGAARLPSTSDARLPSTRVPELITATTPQTPTEPGNDLDQKLVPTSSGVRGAVAVNPAAPVRIEPRAGMGVVFDHGTPEQDEQGGPIFGVDAIADGYRLRFGNPGPDLTRVAVGDFVWISSDPKINRAGEKAAEAGRGALGRIAVRLEVRGAEGSPLEVIARTDARVVHEARGATTSSLQAARGAGITPEVIADKLGGFGGTPFHLAGVDTSGLAAGLHVPVSELKEVRRQLVTQLEAAVVRVDRVLATGSVIESLRADATRTDALDATATVVPLCRTDAQLDAVLDAGVREVELDWMELVGLAKAVDRARARGAKVGVATVRVQKPGEERIDAHLARLAPDHVLVRSWGSLAYFAALPAAERPVLHGDFSLNVTNSITASWVLGKGLATLTASHDLDRDQLLALLDATPAGRIGVTVHHHIPTFHTEHCVYAHLLSTGKDYKTCGRPCEEHAVSLRDRVGLVHPVVVDVGCRNTVFNAQAQSAASLVPDLLARGVRRLRIELVRETADETRRVVDAYTQLVAGTIGPAEVVRRAAVHEQFGVTRGTMRTLTVLR